MRRFVFFTLAGCLASLAQVAHAQCADGDPCVSPAQTASGYVGSAPGDDTSRSSSVSVYVPGAHPPTPPPQPREPEVISSPIEELVIAGGIIASIGYGFSIVAGVAFLTIDPLWNVGEPWTAFIPLVGGFIWAGTDTGCCAFSGVGQLLGGIGSGVQTLGLLLMVIGSLAQETTVVDPHPWEASLEPELVGGPGEVGLGLRWRI